MPSNPSNKDLAQNSNMKAKALAVVLKILFDFPGAADPTLNPDCSNKGVQIANKKKPGLPWIDVDLNDLDPEPSILTKQDVSRMRTITNTTQISHGGEKKNMTKMRKTTATTRMTTKMRMKTRRTRTRRRRMPVKMTRIRYDTIYQKAKQNQKMK